MEVCSFEAFEKKIKEILKAKMKNQYLLIRFDVHNFKLVNALLGIETGNRLLAELEQTFRETPVPEGIFCHLKDDIYCAFTADIFGRKMVDHILDKIFCLDENQSYYIHIHAGVYRITDPEVPVSVMCDRAGMALDTVKDNLHDRVAFYEDTIYERLQLEHELSAQLPGAIRRGELRFDLQPQVEPQGATLGAECLVRWDHPKRGLLMPGVFLPYFEKNYMVVQLDQFIWELACKQLRRWDKEGLQDLYLSVNVSPKDLECINVYDVLLGLVKKYDLDPNRLRVEITESALMENPREQIKWIGRLREAGFYVEMDDFGSGYSSFSMLKDISIDAIKLDMRFLSKSIHEERGKKIIHTIVELARQLKMTVVVEGVETEEQVAFLKQIGCDVFQGYFYARPMSVEDFEQRIQKEKSVRDVTEK